MRITLPVPPCDRVRDGGGWIADQLPAIVVAIVMGLTTACHDDALRTNPVAAVPPALGVAGDGTWMVNSLADPGDGDCTNSECTLREAIAVAQSGERITFKQNLSGTIALTVGELVIARGVTIDGPGPDRIAVSGQDLGRVVRIALGPGVTISGLTFTRGIEPGGPGGGIGIDDGGRLTLIGSVVVGNTASQGGGIDSKGTLTVVGSTIARNTASFGGGGIYSDGALTITRSTVSGNVAQASSGGGIVAACNSECGSGVTLRSSTITANNATVEAGGIMTLTPATISNTIVAGNRVKNAPEDPRADCFTVGGYLVSLGHNLSTQNTGCDLTGPSDVNLPLPSQVFTFVLEPLLAANGSPRLTHALIERGYAVDAGYCPGENGDQRGFPRPFDDPRMPNALDGCDIGAFEWQSADTKIKGPK